MPRRLDGDSTEEKRLLQQGDIQERVREILEKQKSQFIQGNIFGYKFVDDGVELRVLVDRNVLGARHLIGKRVRLVPVPSDEEV